MIKKIFAFSFALFIATFGVTVFAQGIEYNLDPDEEYNLDTDDFDIDDIYQFTDLSGFIIIERQNQDKTYDIQEPLAMPVLPDLDGLSTDSHDIIILPPQEPVTQEKVESKVIIISSGKGDATFVPSPEYLTNSHTVIELPGNPTTGYTWTYKMIPGGIVQEAASGYNATGTGAIGSGGTFNYVFKALKAGRTKLIFTYKRQWENKAPAKEVVVIINVAKDLTITTDRF